MRRPFVFGLLAVLSTLAVNGWSSAPDEWGYRYVSSEEAGGPVFTWRDISAVGQYVPLLDDDNEGPFHLGFIFPFYGQEHESILVCSNGWTSFTSNSHQFNRFKIPSPREPNSLLAPFWTDLDPALAGSVFVYQDMSEFVVSWLGVPHRRGSGRFSFQTVVKADSAVLLQYLSMSDSVYLDSSSVGIENESGGIGLCYFFDGEPGGALADSLALLFHTVEHDVNPITVHSPLERHFTALVCVPTVSVKNYGMSDEFPTIVCTISDSSTMLPLYSDTLTISAVAPREVALVFFQDWVPDEGTRLVRFTTDLTLNDDASLDTLGRYVRVSAHADMAHDDGLPDGWYIVSGSPVSIMGLAVRFTPPYAPYHVIRGKVYVSDTLPFEEVFLAPDDGSGVPDLDNPYAVIAGVHGQSDTAWAFADFDVTVHSSDDVWLVAIWPRGATGPLVGEDGTEPVDSCSYYTVYPPMWNERNTGDWMMRLEIDDIVGVGESLSGRAFSEPSIICGPSPFVSEVAIRVAWGGAFRSLDILDIAGRVVKSFDVESDRSAAIRWDGTDHSGMRVTSGAYFVTLRAGASSSTQKILLVR